MTPTIKLDATQWFAAARALQETSSRTAVDFINGQALRVATFAIKETAKADAAKIAYQLGAVARAVSFKSISRGKNAGKTKTSRGAFQFASAETLADRILTARKAATGSFGVRGNTLDEKANNLIRARTVSVNFIRAAWIPAIRQLASVIKKKPAKVASVGGVRQRGQVKGYSIPAMFRLARVITAEIGIKLFKKPKAPEVAGDPIKVATPGLQKALNMAAKDMTEELARRLNPDFAKFSRK
jgi:hypothetical protein